MGAYTCSRSHGSTSSVEAATATSITVSSITMNTAGTSRTLVPHPTSAIIAEIGATTSDS